MKPRKYQHVFFDLDYTLWDFEHNSRNVIKIIHSEFQLQKMGIHQVTALQNTFATNIEKFWKRFKKGQINREELRWKRFWHTLLSFEIRSKELALQLSDRYTTLLPFQTTLIQDSLDVLEYLRQKKYNIHIITNGNNTTQKMKLNNSGIEQYFQTITTSESCGRLKPDKEIFDFALTAANADKDESIMIGDSIDADILGAKEFGIAQIFFNSRNLFHSESIQFEINNLKELKTIL